MTVVVACWYLKTLVVVADCRVSYTCVDTVDDNLQKLYQIGDRLVLGFAGPLAGAYRVLKRVRANMAQYSKRLVAVSLQTDVERWIRYEYERISNPADRRDLSFLLASVELRREKRSRWRTPEGKEQPKPGWFPCLPEFRVLTLVPSQSRPDDLVREEKAGFKVIGIRSKEERSAIRDIAFRHTNLAYRYPREGTRAA